MSNRRAIGFQEALLAFLLLGFSLPAVALPPAVTASAERLSIEGLMPGASVAIVLASSAVAAEPVAVVEPTKLSVTRVTPGAEVLFFGIGLEPKGYHAVVRRWSTVLTDTDHDGSVTFVLDAPVTWNTLWVIADLRTGKYTITSTPGFPVVRAWLPRRELRRGADGTVTRLLYGRSTAEMLYLVPGSAWTLRSADGDSSDGDRTADGVISIEIERLAGVLPGGTPPRALAPGGTLLVIDQSRFDLLELKLDAELLAGAK